MVYGVWLYGIHTARGHVCVLYGCCIAHTTVVWLYVCCMAEQAVWGCMGPIQQENAVL